MEYRVIKENDLFLITDKNGDISNDLGLGYGLYTKDARFLSRMELWINGEKPILLSSHAHENYLASILATNPHMEKNGELILWRESVQIERKRFIYNGTLYEQVHLTNFFPKKLDFTISTLFDADFNDMFIVRGFQYGNVGKKTGKKLGAREMVISYLGEDKLKRESVIAWDIDAKPNTTGQLEFKITLIPKEVKTITFTITPLIGDEKPEIMPVEKALEDLQQSYTAWNQHVTQASSDHPVFNEMYYRGIQDLRVLLTDLGYGSFPVAGLPWFAVPFGRDSLITAFQMLPLNTEIAKGTLLTMAIYQGEDDDPWRDEQPGKIMHEIRYGELANTNQIPFTPYYGTIDATPLFLMLLAEYYHWTNDLQLVKQLLPNVERAIDWINKYGDRDGDYFVEYYQESSKGIANQGWKDSGDSVVHKNGDYAKAPIALVEVQGYVYQAKTKLAPILCELGETELANRLVKEAQQLKDRFEASFWMPEENFYAIALDYEKKQVKSVTSNPGHIIMSEIAAEARAKQVAHRLVQEDLFSGYGIRTMSTDSAGYNPMSYHDGSVWPHDNSLSLLGLSYLGFKEEAAVVMNGLIKAAHGFEYQRLPELFCGYTDEKGYPVPYPVACSPQAWAAGTSVVLLQTMLGIWPNSLEKSIILNPVLPDNLNELHVKNIHVGEGGLDVRVFRSANKLDVAVIENTTGYQVKVIRD